MKRQADAQAVQIVLRQYFLLIEFLTPPACPPTDTTLCVYICKPFYIWGG